jgi:hypothetical protein
MCNIELSKNYKFDISLMERLISNNLPHVTLRVQNRMRTEFVPLIKQFYPVLESNPRVNDRLPVNCVDHSLFLWDYNGVEQVENGGVVMNHMEADMSVLLASWLVWNSSKEGKDVTVLSLYKGILSVFSLLTV